MQTKQNNLFFLLLKISRHRVLKNRMGLGWREKKKRANMRKKENLEVLLFVCNSAY